MVCGCRLAHPSKATLGQGCAQLKSFAKLAIYTSETSTIFQYLKRSQSQVKKSSNYGHRRSMVTDGHSLRAIATGDGLEGSCSAFVGCVLRATASDSAAKSPPLASACTLHHFTSPLHLPCILHSLFYKLYSSPIVPDTPLHLLVQFWPLGNQGGRPSLIVFHLFAMASCSKK